MAMPCFIAVLVTSLTITSLTGSSIETKDPEHDKTAAMQELQALLEVFSEQYETVIQNLTEALWDVTMDNYWYNKNRAVASQKDAAAFNHAVAENLTRFDTSDLPYSLKRQVIKFLDKRQTNMAFYDVEMKSLYQTALKHLYRGGKVCLDRCYILTELNEMMNSVRNFDILKLIWVEWRNSIGENLKQWFPPFVVTSNSVATLSNYSDAPEYWWSPYEAEGSEFDTEMARLIDEVFPLYQQLHAYARRKLKDLYGDRFPSTGHIPAHVLGDMWAHQWNALLIELVPFWGKPSIDVTHEMLKQNYTTLTMFQKAEDFFESIGLGRMPPTFWKDSLLEEPDDNRSVICPPVAWDLFNNNDFRVSMCSYVITEDLVMAHHLLADMHYILQYQDQPILLREPVNPAFKDAVAGAIELSVKTPYHMDSLGLLNISNVDNETDINFLLNMALQKIAFLPFAYVVEKWRMDVFRGNITEDQYNDYWWELRCKYQGVSPPVERTTADFDAGSVYHIVLNSPFTRNFLDFIMQFQFHKAMCQAAGHSGPLHKCDISNSKDAGQLLKNMMSLGASRPWPEVMEAMTGQRSVSAGPMLEYFDPLFQYLKKENHEDFGWENEC